MAVTEPKGNGLRMNSVQLNLKASMQLVPATDKKKGAQSNSSRNRKMLGSANKTQDVFGAQVDKSAEDPMLDQVSMLQSTVSQIFTRPVDAMRKSKVEQRQAKRESFRKTLNEENKQALLATLTMSKG